MGNNTNLKVSMVIAVLLVGVHCAIAVGGTIYVKATASGDGTSWASAFGNLQDALDAAGSGDVKFPVPLEFNIKLGVGYSRKVDFGVELKLFKISTSGIEVASGIDWTGGGSAF